MIDNRTLTKWDLAAISGGLSWLALQVYMGYDPREQPRCIRYLIGCTLVVAFTIPYVLLVDKYRKLVCVIFWTIILTFLQKPAFAIGLRFFIKMQKENLVQEFSKDSHKRFIFLSAKGCRHCGVSIVESGDDVPSGLYPHLIEGLYVYY